MTASDDASGQALLKVCRLLNVENARYLVIGGCAMALHQVPRFTHDVDLLIEDEEDNFRRVITALAQLADGAANELSPQDFRDNLVVKVADEVEVDVSLRAWVVTYAEALPGARETTIAGVKIPFLGLQDLIRSKQTHRDQDRVDIAMLRTKHGPVATQSEPSHKRSGCFQILGCLVGAALIGAWVIAHARV